ncbi:MAG: hypothetical protein K2O09_04815 [Treponemataceae bacterium]|nr:hypothetical protein [Treponemataceae bacterium]
MAFRNTSCGTCRAIDRLIASVFFWSATSANPTVTIISRAVRRPDRRNSRHLGILFRMPL